MITDTFGRAAANGHRVLEHLYAHPIVSVKALEQATGTTYQAANNIVGRLVEGGVLTEFTGQSRNRQFIYRPYINLFSEES
mgnify:CR=1 FL=1